MKYITIWKEKKIAIVTVKEGMLSSSQHPEREREKERKEIGRYMQYVCQITGINK